MGNAMGDDAKVVLDGIMAQAWHKRAFGWTLIRGPDNPRAWIPVRFLDGVV